MTLIPIYYLKKKKYFSSWAVELEPKFANIMAPAPYNIFVSTGSGSFWENNLNLWNNLSTVRSIHLKYFLWIILLSLISLQLHIFADLAIKKVSLRNSKYGHWLPVYKFIIAMHKFSSGHCYGHCDSKNTYGGSWVVIALYCCSGIEYGLSYTVSLENRQAFLFSTSTLYGTVL